MGSGSERIPGERLAVRSNLPARHHRTFKGTGAFHGRTAFCDWLQTSGNNPDDRKHWIYRNAVDVAAGPIQLRKERHSRRNTHASVHISIDARTVEAVGLQDSRSAWYSSAISGRAWKKFRRTHATSPQQWVDPA